MQPTAVIVRITSDVAEVSWGRPNATTCLGHATEPMPDWDLFGQSEPDFEFDQRVACNRRLSAAGDGAVALVSWRFAVPQILAAAICNRRPCNARNPRQPCRAC
jgi:hypothetical protein